MDWTHPLIIAFAGSIAPSVLALLAYLKARESYDRIQKVQVNLNGNMKDMLDRIMEITGLEAYSRGELKGAENERARQSEKPK